MKKPAGLRWKPWRRNRELVWITQAKSEQPAPLCGGGRTANLLKVALTRCSRVRTRQGKLIYKPTRGEGTAVLAHFGSDDVWCSNHSLWSISPANRARNRLWEQGRDWHHPVPHATGTATLLHFHLLVLYIQKAEEQSLRGKDKEFRLSLTTQSRLQNEDDLNQISYYLIAPKCVS